MRKIFLHIFVSVDGFIEGTDQDLSWMAADGEFEEYINGVLGSIDSMIFGRRSFELLAQYWPTAEENPAAAADPARPERHIEAARMMNAKEKIVFSRTLKATDWANSTIISGDFATEVARVKQRPGRDIALFAGAGLATSFMRLGLIDEYRLLVNPILLGRGTPLFQGGYDRMKLDLVQTRTFGSGAILLVLPAREYRETSGLAMATDASILSLAGRQSAPTRQDAASS
jgi:dihydrofolate reductase